MPEEKPATQESVSGAESVSDADECLESRKTGSGAESKMQINPETELEARSRGMKLVNQTGKAGKAGQIYP